MHEIGHFRRWGVEEKRSSEDKSSGERKFRGRRVQEMGSLRDGKVNVLVEPANLVNFEAISLANYC